MGSKYRIKIVTSHRFEDLENEVNEFLNEHCFEYIDIKYTDTKMGNTAYILYR